MLRISKEMNMNYWNIFQREAFLFLKASCPNSTQNTANFSNPQRREGIRYSKNENVFYIFCILGKAKARKSE